MASTLAAKPEDKKPKAAVRPHAPDEAKKGPEAGASAGMPLFLQNKPTDHDDKKPTEPATKPEPGAEARRPSPPAVPPDP
jgi:hypothetical protein